MAKPISLTVLFFLKGSSRGAQNNLDLYFFHNSWSISDSQPAGRWEINVCCMSQQSVALHYDHRSWPAHGVIPPWWWHGKPLLWIAVIVKEQNVKQEIRRAWDGAIYSPGEYIQENLPAPPGMSVTRSFLCLKSLKDSSHCWGSRPTPDPGSPGCRVSLLLSPDLLSWLLYPSWAHLLSPSHLGVFAWAGPKQRQALPPCLDNSSSFWGIQF